MKAGGLTPPLALLRAARERGLITMLGCMPESAAGVSATAHLGTLADHLDVDAVELLAVDTGQGLTLDAAAGSRSRPARVWLPAGPRGLRLARATGPRRGSVADPP